MTPDPFGTPMTPDPFGTRITGGNGADLMYGESGNDSFYARDGFGHDSVDGGSGTSDNLLTRDDGDSFTNVEIYT